MSEKLRPEELTSEAIKKAATEHAADEYVQLVGDCLSSFILGAMFARRVLFSLAPSEAAKVECPNCGKLTNESHSRYAGPGPDKWTCEPAPPEPAAPEMPEAVTLDGFLTDALEVADAEGMSDDTVIPTWPADIADMGRKLTVGSLRRLSNWWRNHAQPVAVGMTEELADILAWMDVFVRDGQIKTNGLATAQIVQQKIATVRQQAAQVRKVELPKVRKFIEREQLMFKNPDGERLMIAALEELDAHEGRK